jgi:hypothetical protein
MSQYTTSNREGNQQRIMEMHKANLPPIVIAAYMTDWNVPMSAPDVQGIINTYEPMGMHAVRKSDVKRAIQNHQHIAQLTEVYSVEENAYDSERIRVILHEEIDD